MVLGAFSYLCIVLITIYEEFIRQLLLKRTNVPASLIRATPNSVETKKSQSTRRLIGRVDPVNDATVSTAGRNCNCNAKTKTVKVDQKFSHKHCGATYLLTQPRLEGLVRWLSGNDPVHCGVFGGRTEKYIVSLHPLGKNCMFIQQIVQPLLNRAVICLDKSLMT